MSTLKLQLIVVIIAFLENLYLKASKTHMGVFKLRQQNNETLPNLIVHVKNTRYLLNRRFIQI
jgi:hypothetical protein